MSIWEFRPFNTLFISEYTVLTNITQFQVVSAKMYVRNTIAIVKRINELIKLSTEVNNLIQVPNSYFSMEKIVRQIILYRT